jgi:uncharacterized iron-regulated membrane protein
MRMKPPMRKLFRVSHVWLGLVGGLFVCVMSISGAIVTLRPPLAEWLAPSRATQTCTGDSVDWARAEQQLAAFAKEPINRIYTFSDGDPRLHVRMRTSTDAIYDHVIYDACAGRVLGTINFKWMDWLVDLHHNLLAGKTGRRIAGVFGVALLLSALSGAVVWLLGRPNLRTAFQVRLSPARSWRDWHRALGLAAMIVLCLEAYTGLWLCFPDTMRTTLSMIAAVPTEVRAPREKADRASAPPASLASVMARALQAMPDGRVREVRLPEGFGNVQVRMWKPSDFRSLGNNVVTVSNITDRVVAIDLYDRKTTVQRFVQAMAGLHYGEWGGLAFRWLYFAAGMVTLLLFITGGIVWWGPRRTSRRAAVQSNGVDYSVPKIRQPMNT